MFNFNHDIAKARMNELLDMAEDNRLVKQFPQKKKQPVVSSIKIALISTFK